MIFAALHDAVRAIEPSRCYGTVVGQQGLAVDIAGLGPAARLGARLSIETGTDRIEAEITGLAERAARALCFDPLDGVASGARAWVAQQQAMIAPDASWRGRVLDGLGRPIDGGPPLVRGSVPRPLRALPPPAAQRARVGAKLETHVRALDVFAPLCRGQRLGLFAGSGVGKSVLMSMLARETECDLAVIGLVGERGREVQEFLHDELGSDGLARSIVVVATSDAPALMRRQAAWTTLAIAEHFRDQGQHVLCLMDSVTRFAMAQREIGLAGGEPPTTKGYTPTVFAELPRLLERAGPGTRGGGAISGLFTVLVDGDDHNEPIADAVRGILDGHVVMTRAIAERGRYPAIDVLKSVSRTLPDAHDAEENRLMLAARAELSTYADMAELIRLGAYKGGSAEVDRALACAPAIEALLAQGKRERGDAAAAFIELHRILGGAP